MRHWKRRRGGRKGRGVRVLNYLQYREPGFLSVVLLGPSPKSQPFPPLQSQRLTDNTQEGRGRETTCWRKRGVGGEGGAKSYDGKKAWSSINFSILSSQEEGKIGAG